MSYPNDKMYLPVTSEERPGLFSARFEPFGEYVEGWLLYDARSGHKRRYLFYVTLRNGKGNVRISVADVSKGVSFSNRDNETEYGYDIYGMAGSHRKDIQDYALRISNHDRNIYYNWQSFLKYRAENYALEIFVVQEGRRSKVLLKDGEWAVFKFSSPGGLYFFAERLAHEANDQDFLALRSKLIDEEISSYAFQGPLRGY